MLPDPARKVFAGRVFKTLNVIEKVMIQLIVNGHEGTLDIGKIHHPAGLLVQRPADMDLDAERMTVDSPAFVILGDMRQVVRGFDLENLEQVHGRIVPAARAEFAGTIRWLVETDTRLVGILEGKNSRSAGDNLMGNQDA